MNLLDADESFLIFFSHDLWDAEVKLSIVYNLWEEEGNFDKETDCHLPGTFFHFLDHSMLAMFRKIYRRPYVDPEILNLLEKMDVEKTSEALGKRCSSSYSVENVFRKELVSSLIVKSLAFLDANEIAHLTSVASKDEYPVMFRMYLEERGVCSVGKGIEDWPYPLNLNRNDIMAAFNEGPDDAMDFLRNLQQWFTRTEIQNAIDGCESLEGYDFVVLENLGYNFPPEKAFI